MRAMVVLLACCLLTPSVSAQHYVFGGPGTLEGKFQTAGGDLDDQGWVQFYCNGNDVYWQVDTFNAANLNAHGSGNHALWAGQSAQQQPDWNNAPGYGNNWWSVAEWTHAVTNPAVATDVTLQFYYNHETELGYDHFLVEWFDGENWNNLMRADGSNRTVNGFEDPGSFFDETWTMQPADYSGAGGDEVRLRLVVQSDGGVSDQDSLPFPGGETDGAAQVDDIVVLFDGAQVDNGGDFDGIASFESGDDEGWTPMGGPCTCQLLTRLPSEFEPTMQNTTPLIGHVQHEALQTSNFCQFLSPTFDFTAPGSPEEATLQFDVFFDSDTGIGFSDFEISTSWYVDGAWLPNQTVHTGEIPSNVWQTVEVDLTGLAPANATQSYIAVFLHAGNGVFHAMVFDNFAVWRGTVTASDEAPRPSSPILVRPNPSNPHATFQYRVPTAGMTKLSVYNQKGRLVRELLHEWAEPGEREIVFDGRDGAGQALASGVYFLQLTTPDGIQAKRFTLVK